MIAATGWTWEQVDRLTLPRLRTLMGYWADHPPVPVMIAAFLGIKPKGADSDGWVAVDDDVLTEDTFMAMVRDVQKGAVQ